MRIRVQTRPARPAAERVRRGEPITFGVPLPRASTRKDEHWILTDGGSFRRRVQTRALDCWPDGSVRWLLVDAQIDIDPASASELHLEPVDAAPPPEGHPVSLTETGGSVVVDTGAACFTLRVGGVFPFDEVTAGGRSVFDRTASGLKVVEGSGGACLTRIERVAIEERGPLRGAVAVAGSVRDAAGREILGLNARLHFFAGLPTVRLLVTVTNPDRARHRGGFWDLGDAGSRFLKDMSLVLALPPSAAGAGVRCSAEIGLPVVPVETPFALYQDSSGGEHWQSVNHVNRHRRVPSRVRGYRTVAGAQSGEGLRATPVVAVAHQTGQIAATMPHFWENFPKAIEATTSAVTIRLFPQDYADVHEIQGGEQKTHEVFISFGADSVTRAPLDWCRTRVVAFADPAWSLSTGAVPFLARLDQDHEVLVSAAIEGPDAFEKKREVIDEYGWRHFGEIYGDHEAVRHQGPAPLVSHYNNQYDPVAGFACQFLRTGDVRWWRAMSELARHVVDIDVYHTVRDKSAYNHGLFWHTYHYGDADTATHRTYPGSARGRTHGGGPSADHNYTTGLMLHYFLTGEEVSRQTVVDSADYVINLDDGRRTILRWLDRGDTGLAIKSGAGYFGPGRGPANSLNALVDGHRLSGDGRFAAKAEQIVRRVIHPDDDIDRLKLDDPERRWFYTMFLQSLGKYLHAKSERRELDAIYAYGRASLLRYAEWMAEHEYPYLEKPERLEFPTETWAAQDIRKSDVFYFAALHAPAPERERLLERGAFFFSKAVETLQAMPTRALARPVVVLLTSGFLRAWMQQHPDAQAPAPAEAAAFGRPEVFVPQRQRARRRLIWIAGAVAALAVIAIVAALRTL